MKAIISIILLVVCLNYASMSQGLKVEPISVELVDAKYPDYAVKNKLSGYVYVEVSVNKYGHVTNAKVVKSTNALFNKSALDAVKESRFKPALVNRKPVDSQVVLPFKFSLR